jgi:hypothetical protein
VVKHVRVRLLHPKDKRLTGKRTRPVISKKLRNRKAQHRQVSIIHPQQAQQRSAATAQIKGGDVLYQRPAAARVQRATVGVALVVNQRDSQGVPVPGPAQEGVHAAKVFVNRHRQVGQEDIVHFLQG